MVPQPLDGARVMGQDNAWHVSGKTGKGPLRIAHPAPQILDAGQV